MPAKPIVPLIVAVALFMENMDSTVIATSLPAIAADIGTSPLTLKLAVTSYLISLAVFIPVSGWTADRFGARTVFRGAIAVFMLGDCPPKYRARAETDGGPAAHRDEDREREQVGGDRELKRQRARADIGGDRRQRGGDDGRVHVLHEQGDRHDQ